MAGYIPHYQKKNRIAAKRERELIHAIRNELESARVERAAERLREAKLAAAKSRWAAGTSAQSHEFDAAALARKDKSVARWLSSTTEEIVEIYSRGTRQTED